MKTTNPRSPWEWREERRLRAWALHQRGWMGKTIAEALGVSQGAVSQWLKRAREGGVEALYSQPPPGPTSRLTTEQLAQLPHLLARGAEAFGFIGEVWTVKRVAAVIREEFERSSASATIRIMSGGCCAPPGGVLRSPSAEPPNATKQRLSAGALSGGWRLKQSPGREAYHRLGR